MKQYHYYARFLRAVDGDTIDVILDLGFKVNVTQRLRLARIDCHEMHDPDPKNRALAVKAKESTEALMKATSWISVETFKNPTDKYGRYIAEVNFLEGSLMDGKMISLSDRLMELGLAKIYQASPVPGETL